MRLDGLQAQVTERGDPTPDRRAQARNVITGEVRDGLYTFRLDGKPVDLPILMVDGSVQDLGMWAIVDERE